MWCHYSEAKFLQNIYKRHPIAHLLGQCLGWFFVGFDSDILPLFLQWCVQCHVILDHIIPALECIMLNCKKNFSDLIWIYTCIYFCMNFSMQRVDNHKIRSLIMKSLLINWQFGIFQCARKLHYSFRYLFCTVTDGRWNQGPVSI